MTSESQSDAKASRALAKNVVSVKKNDRKSEQICGSECACASESKSVGKQKRESRQAYDNKQDLACKVLFVYDSKRGAQLAEQLLSCGHDVNAFIPDYATNISLTSAPLVTDLAIALKNTHYIITLLVGPSASEDVLLEKNGIIQQAQSGSYIVDLSVSTPRFAREMNALAAVYDCFYLDAPLCEDISCSGGTNARILLGGEEDSRAAVLGLLADLKIQVVQTGGPGTGAASKVANIATQASILLGLAESLAYAHDSNVSKDALFRMISTNPHRSASEIALAKMMLDEDYNAGYPLAQFYAELTVALDAADEINLAMPSIETAHQLFDLLMMIGASDRAVQALVLVFSEEQQCRAQGLDWDLAQRFMDVYDPQTGDWHDNLDDNFDGIDDFDDCEHGGCGHKHN
ncbi:MAG: NAD-binding protein [Coriobacteriales bacterium]|nr:NAD-binding protein [Coriobacteriales bacterium]